MLISKINHLITYCIYLEVKMYVSYDSQFNVNFRFSSKYIHNHLNYRVVGVTMMHRPL